MLKDATVFATIAVRDAQLAKDFYQNTLGLRLVDENAAGCMYESGSGKLFVYQSPTAGTSQATSAAWEVDDIEAVVDELQQRGVVFEQYDIPDADVNGYVYTLGPQKAAWFTDPDGNILSVGSSIQSSH
jgi:catechol 2,3-dioxygenase-like lactoylglutathione lyase family enzyme